MPFFQSSSESDKLDVELMFPGDRFPVVCGPSLRSSGWRGGLWVQYTTSDEGDFVVEVSDGTAAAGFLLFSSEDADSSTVGGSSDLISYQPATGVGGQNVMTMISGGTRAFFKVYETTALSGGTRSGGDISYSLQESLKISENGLLCNDSDAALAAAGISDPIVVGIVSAIPSSRNKDRLGADIKY